MTAHLRAALQETAQAAPPIAVPPGLFARARRRHRQRQAMALLATVAVVALLVFGVYPQMQRSPVQPAQSAPPGLPTRLVHAPRFTAALERAPLDREVAVFGDPYCHSDESCPLTVVGPDDQYRTYGAYGSSGPMSILFSPDGRQMLVPGGLLELSTGRTRTLPHYGSAVAWAPDGTRVVLITQPDDSAEPLVFDVVDVATGNVEQSVSVAAGVYPRAQVFDAALSPDGTELAIQTGDEVQLYRGGTLRWRIETTGSWLAGPAAFTPTGDLALFRYPNEMYVLAAASGAQVSSQAYPALPTIRVDQGFSAAQLVAWRDGVPIVVTANRVVLLSDPATVLLTAPVDAAGLAIATDTLGQPAVIPGRPQAGPFLVRFRTPLIAGALAVPLLLLTVFGVRRLRRIVQVAARWQREADSR